MIPRYLAESVIGKGWSWRVYVLRIVCLLRPTCISVAFVNVKFHLPGEFPVGYRIKVSLQKGGIVFGVDAAVEYAIISKETDCTIDGFVGEVVDVYQK